jgi:hypothetical protein
LEPGQEEVIAEYMNPGAISSFTVKRPKITREESLNVLREITNSMTWDNDISLSVWAPLGDFFGTGGGENLYRTLATGMTENEYYCNWFMPYKKAVIKVRNDGKKPRNLTFTIHTQNIEKGADSLLRYHCKWHRDDFSGFNKERLLSDRWPDWPVLKVDAAKGRFVGFNTHIWNPNHNHNEEHKKYKKPIPEGVSFEDEKAFEFTKKRVLTHFWWGEGDEKFFVDGEKMPSTFGTGTEDYFGYAWGNPMAYDSGLQAQPRNGAANEIGKEVHSSGLGNIGHISLVRWQIADNVPFQKSFEAVIKNTMATIGHYLMLIA